MSPADPKRGPKLMSDGSDAAVRRQCEAVATLGGRAVAGLVDDIVALAGAGVDPAEAARIALARVAALDPAVLRRAGGDCWPPPMSVLPGDAPPRPLVRRSAA